MSTETKEFWGRQGESWKTGSQDKRDRMDDFLEWLLTPKSLREPSSKAKLAAEWGISQQTLRNYEKDPGFQRRLMEATRGVAKVEKLPDILDTLFQQATDPLNPRSVAAAKLLLDHMEKLVPTSEIDAVDVKSMDTEQLANLAVALLQKLNDA